MADYFTRFSFAIPALTDDETAWLTRALAYLDETASTEGANVVPPGPPAGTCILTAENIATGGDCTTHDHDGGDEFYGLLPDDYEMTLGFDARLEQDRSLWIYDGGESGEPSAPVPLVSMFLELFRPDGHIEFEWANTCSKPCLDAFSGGACIVTATGAQFHHTGGWLADRIAELEQAERKKRLEYLRGEIQAERISYGELSELQGLVEHIDAGDVELLEWAGVPEDSTETHETEENR